MIGKRDELPSHGNWADHADRIINAKLETLHAIIYSLFGAILAVPLAYGCSLYSNISFYTIYAIIGSLLALVGLAIPLYRLRGASKVMRIDAAIDKVNEGVASIQQYITFMQKDQNLDIDKLKRYYDKLDRLNDIKIELHDLRISHFTDEVHESLQSLEKDRLKLKPLEELENPTVLRDGHD